MVIAKNTTILMASGEYDDYCHYGLYIAIKDVDVDHWLQRFKDKILENTYIEDEDDYSFEYEDFIRFLVFWKVIEKVGVTEWNLGSYGRLYPDVIRSEP